VWERRVEVREVREGFRGGERERRERNSRKYIVFDIGGILGDEVLGDDDIILDGRIEG
jgi:hypothetical protein